MNPSITNPLFAAKADLSDALITKDATVSRGPNDDPTVIVIFGWLGAKMVTLRKYANAYQNLFPSSAQVIVTADPLRFWKLQSVRERAVLQTVRKFEELNIVSGNPESSGEPPKILMHALSNGGAMSLYDFASVLRRRNLKAPDGTKCAIIFDSAPAPGSLVLAIRAFTAGLRSRFKKYMVALVLTIVLSLTFIIRTIFRLPEPLSVLLQKLNDPLLLPWTSVRTPRMYLYSNGDKIVPAQAVEEHAAQARMAGFPVQMMNFGKSDHVSHARDFPGKYWETVRTFWDEAIAH